MSTRLACAAAAQRSGVMLRAMRKSRCLALGCLFSMGWVAAETDHVSFNRDIRPIMSDTCFRCHGPDKNARMAGMRLDIREEALRPMQSAKIPIVPGDPDKSEIIERIFDGGAKIMPPAYVHKELTQKQKDTIRRWVSEGAVYEGHWAYQPLQRPQVPNVGDASVVKNPIDNFIQSRLKQEGLAVSSEADKRTLLRRVTIDLTGLLPTPEDLTAFLSDTTVCLLRRGMPNSARCTGWMLCVMRIPVDSMATILYPRGPIETMY
jgi:hypothetical protein